MNRRQLISRVAETMRAKNLRKEISLPKKILHITDDEGSKKDFVIKSTEKRVLFTFDDIEKILDTAIEVIEESLKIGEPVTIKGFGSLGLKYRKARSTKSVGTDEWISIDARYIPKFSFGNDLRLCAKLYELSLSDLGLDQPLPVGEDIGDSDGS